MDMLRSLVILGLALVFLLVFGSPYWDKYREYPHPTVFTEKETDLSIDIIDSSNRRFPLLLLMPSLAATGPIWSD